MVLKRIQTLRKMRSSVILDITNRDPGGNAKAIEAEFGARVLKIGGDQIGEAYDRASRTEAQEWAGRWIREADEKHE